MRFLPLLLSPIPLLGLSPASAQPVSFSGPELQCVLDGPLLDEISGLAPSRVWPGSLWVLQDEARDTRLCRFDESGQHLQTIAVSGARAENWEDLAPGPLPDGSPGGLYVGDIGDNQEEDDTFQVLVLDERSAERGSVVAPVAVITARFPDGPKNCEALFVSWQTRDIFVLTKEEGRTRLLRLRFDVWSDADATIVAEDLGRVRLRELGTEDDFDMSYRVTGAAISPDGRLLAVRTYHFVYVYPVSGEPDIADLEAGPTQVLSTRQEPQGEAVAFTPDGQALLTASERSLQILRFARMR